MTRCYKCSNNCTKENWKSPTGKPVWKCVLCDIKFWIGKNKKIIRVFG